MSKLAKALTAAAGNAAGESLYVEDVFSTYLYTGNGSTQTITNGIDLDGEGGLVWLKKRNNLGFHWLHDTERLDGSGIPYYLSSNDTAAQGVVPNGLTAFNSNGFTLGDRTNWNDSGSTFTSWTFRKAEKFFDVVTYTGTGSLQSIAHNLGSTPAFYVVKRTDGTSGWTAYHHSLNGGVNAEDYIVALNSTSQAVYAPNEFSEAPTDSHFSVGTSIYTNTSGGTYVAYLFASDAGGFGDDGSESIIKCGSFTTDASGSGLVGPDLGFEPQWVLLKNATSTASGGWWIFDVMRGFTASGGGTSYLLANSSGAEGTFGGETLNITSNGFTMPSNAFASGQTFIYIAIRRPMKTPESGTEVFAIDNGNGTSGYDSGFPVDMGWRFSDIAAGSGFQIASRLNAKKNLYAYSSNAENNAGGFTFDSNIGWGTSVGINTNDYSWMFKRATGFFDVVAYTAAGSPLTENHNLGVAPEAIIVKKRSGAANWTWSSGFGGTLVQMEVNTTNASSASNGYIDSVTSTTFTTGGSGAVLSSGTYIAYLFASVAGVSKVGSYTGSNNVGPQTIDCGFSTGARFVLIKNTGIGEWLVFDVERGITVGSTDGVLQLQSTSQEYTEAAWGGGDMIQPHPSGFTLTTNGQLNSYTSTYIFLAIA